MAGEGRWGCRRQGIGQKGSQSLLDNYSVYLLPNLVFDSHHCSSAKFLFVCSHPPFGIHLGRYNMIFVETSAKDNTGVEQVTIHIFPPTNPILSFAFCNRRICRLSWSWWTECCKAQASGAPAKHSPALLPLRLDLPSWGESKHLNASLSFFLLQASTKKNLQSPALLWNLNRCILAVF